MGKPGWTTPVIHAPIHNAWKGTRGTETSKYPEEEKETSISLVAASERERAQTRVRAFWGSDCERYWQSVIEGNWENPPERVKASYMKRKASQQDPEYRETRGTLREYGGTTPQG